MLPAERTSDILRRYYTLFNAGDREALLALLADNVAHDINQGGCERGVETFRGFLSRMDRCYREQVEDLVIFSSGDGARAAAEFYIRGEYLVTDEGLPAAAGQKYRLRIGAFFEIQDGRIARVTNYYNLSEWLRQVGA